MDTGQHLKAHMGQDKIRNMFVSHL
jgi:hypothetical protein